jgi:hypothetical protein
MGWSGIAKSFVCIAVALGLFGSALAKDIYVSPKGSAQGDGTQAAPLALATALNDATKVVAGDTVWLMAGAYKGPFSKGKTPAGTVEKATTPGEKDKVNPIIYRAMPGARVTLTSVETAEHLLDINCSYVWFWGLEITVGGKAPEKRGDAVHMTGGDGVKIINCAIHDNPNRSGIGGWDVGNDQEFYGCLLYRNGIFGGGLAHGIYTQNTAAHTMKRMTDCLVFDNFGFGVHCYGQSPELANYTFDGVVAYGNGMPPGDEKQKPTVNMLVGGYKKADNMVIRNCLTYFPNKPAKIKRGVDFGYISQLNGKLTVENNVFIGGLSAVEMKKWQEVTFKGNTLYTPNGPLLVVVPPEGFDPKNSDVDGNTYYKGPTTPLSHAGKAIETIEDWRTLTGWDKAGKMAEGPPASVMAYLRPNKYEPDRAFLVVYNWPCTPSVKLDVGKLWDIKPGQQYNIVHVDDIWGKPVAQGTFDGQPVEIKMLGAYAPEFACYVVTRK